jgi:diacylglycerol O-acyltransferase / wax synthase
MWFLTGLRDGDVGMLIRLQHVVADGLAAMAMIGALLDPAAGAPAQDPPPWDPRPVPDGWQLAASALRQFAPGWLVQCPGSGGRSRLSGRSVPS